MKQETKKEVKKNVATGASTGAGAAAGVVIGTALSPEQASAQEMPAPEPLPQAKPTSETAISPEPTTESTSVPEPQPNPEPQPVQNPTPEPQQINDEVEVIGYDRLTNEYGAQMDVAVLNVNGNEVGVMDVNLDGEADAVIFDANQNGIIEDNEILFVQGEGIGMQPFANAAGFNPLFAQNDLPDYVNDADVDTYMV